MTFQRESRKLIEVTNIIDEDKPGTIPCVLLGSKQQSSIIVLFPAGIRSRKVKSDRS